MIQSKTIKHVVFVFNDLNDLGNLIKFIGKPPVISIDKAGKIVLGHRKYNIYPGAIIFRNSYGEVTNVTTPDKLAENFDILSELDFEKEHMNKIVEKVKMVPEKAKK